MFDTTILWGTELDKVQAERCHVLTYEDGEGDLIMDIVFVRDFVPSALAFLMNGEPDIVKKFFLKTLHLQGWEKRVD
ncbi:hypothetical protein Ahy_B01g053043 isoform B [Arachis hypogaea]|uniref:Uncharacterized protein n=1 Tax=Arachis hypogaea TaxID=3818 RepID=A0A445AQY8_ARAHY|nr:hypothetical protein Ahy_B01g053043 isoform B [Arachis hypogaea]